jgi:DNA-binding MarR family transcriptional regulator
LTAPFHESDARGEVGRACNIAADGRRAVRALGQWCQRFEITEPEFQVLWCLRNEANGGFDQTTLARWLAYSPAQVSSTVERLRTRGWIAQQIVDGDRRRNMWRLTASGGSLVAEMLHATAELQSELLRIGDCKATSPRREAA